MNLILDYGWTILWLHDFNITNTSLLLYYTVDKMMTIRFPDNTVVLFSNLLATTMS